MIYLLVVIRFDSFQNMRSSSVPFIHGLSAIRSFLPRVILLSWHLTSRPLL